VIVTPGGTVQYDVPIMRVQTYSLDDIFEKGTKRKEIRYGKYI